MTDLPNGKKIYVSKPQFSKATEKSFGGKSLRKSDDHRVTVMNANLFGAYSYFLCPICSEVMQFNVLELWEYPSDQEVKKSPCQHLVFETWCRKCQMGGTIKLNSGTGFQEGNKVDWPSAPLIEK